MGLCRYTIQPQCPSTLAEHAYPLGFAALPRLRCVTHELLQHPDNAGKCDISFSSLNPVTRVCRIEPEQSITLPAMRAHLGTGRATSRRRTGQSLGWAWWKSAPSPAAAAACPPTRRPAHMAQASPLLPTPVAEFWEYSASIPLHAGSNVNYAYLNNRSLTHGSSPCNPNTLQPNARLQVELPKARKVACGGHEVRAAHQRAHGVWLKGERARANRLGQAVVRVAPVRGVIAVKALPVTRSRRCGTLVLCQLSTPASCAVLARCSNCRACGRHAMVPVKIPLRSLVRLPVKMT